MALKVWGAGSTQGSDGQWDTATNWDNDILPVDGDSLLFDASALYPLISGPTSTGSVIIENIQVTSDALVPYINGPLPLVVVGQLNSASASAIYISIYPYGITSIVGAWLGNVIYPTSKPVNNTGIAYLGISQVLFDTSNYLDLAGGGISELKYGLSDIFLNVYGEAPFTSFTIDTVNGNFTGFSLTGVSKITSQVIEFDSTVINFFGFLQLDTPVVNITQIGSLINYTGGGFGLPNLTFPQLCTLNISSPSGGPYPNPINENLIFTFEAGGTINLYGQATIYGTNSPTGAGIGLQLSEALLATYGPSIFINAYNNSLVGGLYVNGAFTNASLTPSISNYCIVNMRDNSIFQGLITNFVGSGINFFNSSNVSFNYQLAPTGTGGTFFQAFTSTVVVGEGDIPQSTTGGLTIFKASF
jgi:hypothetical protein